MDKPIPISPAQLLLVDPTAYANLCLLFPSGDDPLNPEALALDAKVFQLLLVSPREAVLLSKNPPGILQFDHRTCQWEAVKLESDKG